MPTEDTRDFRKGYQLVVMHLERHIGLRNRYVPVVKNKEAGNKASTCRHKDYTPLKDSSKNVTEPKGKEREDNPRSSNQG